MLQCEMHIELFRIQANCGMWRYTCVNIRVDLFFKTLAIVIWPQYQGHINPLSVDRKKFSSDIIEVLKHSIFDCFPVSIYKDLISL